MIKLTPELKAIKSLDLAGDPNRPDVYLSVKKYVSSFERAKFFELVMSGNSFEVTGNLTIDDLEAMHEWLGETIKVARAEEVSA